MIIPSQHREEKRKKRTEKQSSTRDNDFQNHKRKPSFQRQKDETYEGIPKGNRG